MMTSPHVDKNDKNTENGGKNMSNSKMSARERIEYLLDTNSFVELGNLISARSTDYNIGAHKSEGDGVITGYGILGDRMVYVYSQDASVLGGSVGEMHAKKISSLYDMAMKTGAPIIGMLDCAGLRLQEANDALNAFGEIFMKQVQASGKIPQISAVFGMCGGGSAVMNAMSDFTFVEKENGKLFVNSPNALEDNKTVDTAAADYQAEAGNVDFVCEGEADLLDQLRILVDMLPSNYEAGDIDFECEDDLNRVIPELNDAEYEAKYILSSISDNSLYMEAKADYAKDMITAFIRLDGQTIGAIANQPVDGASVLTAKGMEKAERFVKFCDAFDIPVLALVNAEGLKAVMDDEKKMAKSMAQMIRGFADSTVPKVTLIAGKAFGTAGVAMNSKAIGADFVLAWPEASIGMMDAGQAVRIMYAAEINGSTDQLGLIAEKTAEYTELQSSAIAAAKRGYVDDIIEPDATRKRLIAAYNMLFGKKEMKPQKKHTAI